MYGYMKDGRMQVGLGDGQIQAEVNGMKWAPRFRVPPTFRESSLGICLHKPRASVNDSLVLYCSRTFTHKLDSIDIFVS
jgi:hypothetical protein